jgi:hypothetical protein
LPFGLLGNWHRSGRRDAARPLALVVPLGSARRHDAVAPDREAS